MGRWVYVLDHNGDRGEVKGLKDNLPFAYDREFRAGEEGARKLACSLRSGTVLSRKVVGETAHFPRQSDSPVRPHRNRGHTRRQKTNRQVKQAAEGSQEG